MTPTDALSVGQPFAGLRTYGYVDHEFFFGREDQSYALYRLIDTSGFTSVIGSSGSGKSSLVLAGLLPLLKAERDEGGRNWHWEIMRPGDAPLASLTELLARLADDQDPAVHAERARRIDYHVRRSSFALADALREIDGFENKTLFLVVDQFEELFRFSYVNRVNPSPGQDWARNAAAQFVQILLEADRNPKIDVHVLITMRSDFIGDCARFHGLPEAVSACQYLVPALARSQLEEAITKPIERAGASIAPQLVQRLLNDSSDEMDQLPVLQHCLLRLWKESEYRRAVGSLTKMSPEAEEHNLSGHVIIEDDYVAVGKLSGSLSQHANQILRTLPESQVELVFRALSDADKDGRVVRRSILFEQLQAETGIADKELRMILEPFRVNDCSFLRPSPLTQPMLQFDTRIDIGHEALLRRWERVSGDPNESGQRRFGWWRIEENDGQQYRVLLFMLETGTDTLPSASAEANIEWWKEHRRTKAWAERYGGRYDDVERLLANSERALQAEREWIQTQEKRAKKARRNWLIFFIALPISIALVGAGIFAYIKETAAYDSAVIAGEAAEQLKAQVYQILILRDKNALSVAGAQQLLDEEEHFVRGLPGNVSTPGILELRCLLSFTYSDLFVHYHDLQKALQYARDGESYADQLVSLQDPEREAYWYSLDYAAASRVGTLLMESTPNAINVSLKEYRKAQTMADAAVKIDEKNPGYLLDQGVSHRQLGDILSSFDVSSAKNEYEESLKIMKDLVNGPSSRPQWRGELASTQQRLGRLFLKTEELDQAESQFQSAFSIREKLVNEDRTNEIFISNLASSYSDLAALNEKEGDLVVAINDYDNALGLEIGLSRSDEENLSLKLHLADTYGDFEGLVDRYVWLQIAEPHWSFLILPDSHFAFSIPQTYLLSDLRVLPFDLRVLPFDSKLFWTAVSQTPPPQNTINHPGKLGHGTILDFVTWSQSNLKAFYIVNCNNTR